MNFMHFVIAMGCVSAVELFYKLEYLSVMVVQVSLNGLKRCTKICKNGLHHQHRADIRSYSCVGLRWLNGVSQYWSRNLWLRLSQEYDRITVEMLEYLSLMVVQVSLNGLKRCTKI
ncbi:hypothetical protein Tsp_05955, partial [Trichinella spiralis]|uniref:hypothetical protein n=1 Tax=Trichinella spiralis TaxID=6334 RepID=UPI0001EFCBD1